MKKSILLAGLMALSTFTMMADNEWIHVYTTDSKGITRVASHSPLKTQEIKYVEGQDGHFTEMEVTDNEGNVVTHDLDALQKILVGSHVPTLYIDIENNAEVVEKETYLNAVVELEGNGVTDDFAATEVSIKGRGNSTWYQFPKKPWRLKFSKKQELAGLKKAKNFALIANFIDPTNMRNTVALHLGQMLEMPWTNHSIPVNIVMNGTYRGLYMLTEKVGINSGSVDIEETEGILWELDTNYDETYKFHSAGYNLPVMVKDPDFDELYTDNPTGPTQSQMLADWRSDFEQMESAVLGKNGADWTEYIDLESAVKYVFVYVLTGNREPGWPKSTYLYKERKGEKYYFGPLWDFDWAYTFGGNYQEGVGDPSITWVGSSWEPGALFFRQICSDSRFREQFKALVDRYYESDLEEVMEFIDNYAELIRPAAYQDGERWPQGCDYNHTLVASSEKFDEHLDALKQFLKDRISYMHSSPNFCLY